MANRGSPCRYTEELAQEICERLRAGESLRGICRSAHVPPPSTVMEWVEHDMHGFRLRYMLAREAQAHAMAEELLEIADDGSNDWMEKADDKGGVAYQANGEHVQRSRLRVDTRKWILAKMLPKVYGDRTILMGDKDNPIRAEVTIDTRPPLLSFLDEWKPKPAE